jgi:hypothetical protein
VSWRTLTQRQRAVVARAREKQRSLEAEKQQRLSQGRGQKGKQKVAYLNEGKSPRADMLQNICWQWTFVTI